MITILEFKEYFDKIIEEILNIADPPINTNEEFEELNRNLLCSKLNLDIDVVEVRKCPNRPDDFGIFAKRDIKKNEVLTLYPVDTYEDKLNNIFYGNLERKHHTNHLLKLSLNNIISGDPKLYTNNYCAHMCNDGAKYLNPDNSEERTNLYMKISKLKQNADIVKIGIIPCLIAIKDIKSDDEVLIHYGVCRWEIFNQP